MTRRSRKQVQPGKRRFPRRAVDLWASINGSRHAVVNLSAGGLFVQQEAPLPVGVTVWLELALPERTVRAQGTVIHATATEQGEGNGIEWHQISTDDRDAIAEFVGGTPPHDPVAAR